jgi:hypothetical protein
LFFSGTVAPSSIAYGTYVTVVDQAGAAYVNLSKTTDGKNIINPKLNPMTIEYWLYIPSQANSDQVVLDKHSGSFGFLSGLNSTLSTTLATNSFYISSGSAYEQLSVSLTKGQWNHVAWVWDRTPGYNGIYAYLNGQYYASSSMSVEFETIDTTNNLYIGSGSALSTVGYTPTNTLSGALDDLRIWHSVRSKEDIYNNYQKSIFADSNLKLYYKFNEPSGSNAPIVIDASSNSLHGNLSGDRSSYAVSYTHLTLPTKLL